MSISAAAPASQVLNMAHVQGVASKARSFSRQTVDTIQSQLDAYRSEIALETKRFNHGTNNQGIGALPKDAPPGAVEQMSGKPGGIDILA